MLSCISLPDDFIAIFLNKIVFGAELSIIIGLKVKIPGFSLGFTSSQQYDASKLFNDT